MFITNQALAQAPSLTQLQKVSDECLYLIKNGKFKEAVELFHFPPSYTVEEVKKDQDAVKLGLQEMTNLFGIFGSVDLLKEPAVYINIPLGGGDIPYWRKYPKTYKLEYKTEFQNEGSGFIIFQLVDISKKIEIRSISYGLSATAPNVRERMTKIGKHMMDFMMSLSSNDHSKTGI
jgi:hypothetical protein